MNVPSLSSQSEVNKEAIMAYFKDVSFHLHDFRADVCMWSRWTKLTNVHSLMQRPDAKCQQSPTGILQLHIPFSMSV
jgi:hypothetical protein